jgi:hypothetical protein
MADRARAVTPLENFAPRGPLRPVKRAGTRAMALRPEFRPLMRRQSPQNGLQQDYTDR